ncbi:MAG: AAA family ATPase, partial [Planctomycetes bacterium]|nr:AAA family ATPase [Planctomycetota bacterium]
MAKIKSKQQFGCNNCGDIFAKWSGKCHSCGAMNAISELNTTEVQLLADKKAVNSGTALKTHSLDKNTSNDDIHYLNTGLNEFNRVLGGGMPAGAVILLGGEPGIGKSTLLAQCCGQIQCDKDVLYVTAEESINQVRDRFHRLNCVHQQVQLAAASDCEEIARSISSGKYALAVIDSIQLVSSKSIEGVPGSVSQVRSCAARLVEVAKASETTLILIGHVTKDGGLAG